MKCYPTAVALMLATVMLMSIAATASNVPLGFVRHRACDGLSCSNCTVNHIPTARCLTKNGGNTFYKVFCSMDGTKVETRLFANAKDCQEGTRATSYHITKTATCQREFSTAHSEVMVCVASPAMKAGLLPTTHKKGNADWCRHSGCWHNDDCYGCDCVQGVCGGNPQPPPTEPPQPQCGNACYSNADCNDGCQCPGAGNHKISCNPA